MKRDNFKEKLLEHIQSNKDDVDSYEFYKEHERDIKAIQFKSKAEKDLILSLRVSYLYTLYNLGKYNDALSFISYLQQTYKLDYDKELRAQNILYNKARILSDTNQPRKAKIIFEKLVKLDSENFYYKTWLDYLESKKFYWIPYSIVTVGLLISIGGLICRYFMDDINFPIPSNVGLILMLIGYFGLLLIEKRVKSKSKNRFLKSME